MSRFEEIHRGSPSGVEEYLHDLEMFFDQYAARSLRSRARHSGYHEAVASIARFYIPPGARVLEVGCGAGDLLASLQPSYGVGIDLSQAMVQLAEERYPKFVFHHMAAERLKLPEEKFDYIVLSDLVGYLYDIRSVFERLADLSYPRTRLVIHWYSRLWQPVLHLLERLGLKDPLPYLNWTTVGDIDNLLRLAGFETVRQRGHILLPVALGVLGRWVNRFLAPLPVARWFVWTNWVIARPIPRRLGHAPRVSVICPCRDEKGNIEDVVRRLPPLGSHTELIFVEGHSGDGTLAECYRIAARYVDRDIKILVQEGQGKGDAVRLGFARASGELLMVLDADLSVDPEDLRQFYDAVVSNTAEFAVGSRLVYAVGREAMRLLNLAGNKCFGILLSALIGQPIKDTLCGTKVVWRNDYLWIASVGAPLGGLDPYGDFELLFGAARLNLRIVEIPVRYHARRYGSSKIRRFAEGWLLLKMSLRAALRLFFIPSSVP